MLVLALIGGLLSLTSSSSDSKETQAAHRDLRPFREAVDDLAAAPGLRYKDTSSFGITENEINVTASGSQFGSTSSGRGNDHGRDVLRIGGKKFMRWQHDPAPKEDVKEGAKAPPSEWVVGLDDGSELVDEALARTVAPPKLAAVLDKALTELEKSPPAKGSALSNSSGQRPSNVNGTPALGVDTSAGRLLVTKAAPHRVLRLEAYDLREGISDMREQIEKGEVPEARPRVTTGPLASGDGEGMDLTPILADAADKMFDTLVEYADQLKDATDRGIYFTLDGAGEMDCSSSGCTATQNFTGSVSSIARKERVTKGEVTAVMSATFSINGKPAGQCTSPQRTFPVRGNNVSGTLKCSNPGAGPLYASVAARVQAQAQADADRCRCKVRLTYPLRANTLIDARALAKVEARKLADHARRERDAATCAKPHSFPSGTRVLLADGATRAIEDIRVGDRVSAGNPHVGLTAARPVTNTFTTEGDKDFTRLTVTTDHGPATITATDNHPFWLEGDRRWKDAGDLRVGDHLHTPNGASVAVTEARDQRGPQRTYDLTVNGLHTYYVLAGATPVLVHNTCGDVALGAGEGTADALKAFTSTKPETEFVFDSGAGRFLAGDRERIPGGLSPHEQLAEKAGMDKGTVLGGTLFRDNGRLVFTENSGHYGHRWTDSTRQQFQTFMSDQGIDFDYRPWG
ncbi:polymorphic toxin-type HINT domain-containing protein [Streptomyces sp. NBC_01336]|uniref:polymorphic toxin-type HINT domain-containing protein n=1 Tax=Streptomyces sp. NBC_01336 TaxID=2903829 RepID=UPI002E0F99ED|nr:polymorphic toxin-type HINT domain-containing protein [Streptomyces sp. NBC_01336]